MNATMHEQLQRARDIFAERGGAQLTVEDEEGRICLINTLTQATGTLPSLVQTGGTIDPAAIEPLAQAIGLTVHPPRAAISNADHVCDFNNTHSKEEILDRLDKALAAYEVVCA